MDSDNSMCFCEKITSNSKIGKITEDILNNIQKYKLNTQSVDRIKSVVFEAEKNIIMYAGEGFIEVQIEPSVFKAIFKDKGPGIKDIGLAFKDGYSTANDEAKKMGYGLGKGLTVIRDNVDYLDVASIPDVGTTIEVAIAMN